jgi:hypothetical protein
MHTDIVRYDRQAFLTRGLHVLSASQICVLKRFSRQLKCLSLSTKSEKREGKWKRVEVVYVQISMGYVGTAMETITHKECHSLI